MKKITETFKTHKYAIIWTLCYMSIMWAILFFLFNFNMFNGAQWHRLFNSKLLGFPGFVFGILILSALPMYVATTTLIIRNKKPLVTIPVPKIPLSHLFAKTVDASPAPDTEPEPEQEPQNSKPGLSADIPPELHAAFIRARETLRTTPPVSDTPDSSTPSSNLDNIIPTNTPSYTDIPSSDTDNDFPLPSDFDFELPQNNDMPSDFAPMSAPVFTEITFGDDAIAPTETAETSPSQHIPETHESYVDTTQLTAHLEKSGTPYTTDGDLIITDTHVIATHSDPDFWVVDNENWFATGKVRPSPIINAQTAATKQKKTPAIYLASENILDIDSLKQTWSSDGITVITDLTEL